jgi:diguanylate cyclase (GGDEF)-like protein
LSNYAFLLFAVLQTIHMNRRYLQALSRAETLRNELEERVEERTRELTEANRRLAEQATTDGLTGLKNRRAFNDAFSTELARLSRSSEKLCLALLDIDFFKAVNDSHGHDGGDQVLKNVAQLLQSQLRSTDTVARIGGEEFAVLLPTHHIAGAKARLEELRERIEASPLEDEDKSIFITVSIGLTEVTTEDGIKSASKRADEALYAAKRAGRNQLKTA